MGELSGEKKRFFERAMAEIRALPLEQRLDAMLQLVICILEVMDRETILDLRAKIHRLYPHMAEHDEGGDSIIDLIDGHLSLRALRDDSVGAAS